MTSKIELTPVGKVRPYETNPRTNDAAVETVAGLIRDFGFLQPIVVDLEGVIVAGHTRYKAALSLGMEEVPVIVARSLTPEQCRAWRIADNRSHELAAWDMDLLQAELVGLATNYDIALLGWSPKELETILAPKANEGFTDPDDVPEPPDAPTTGRGDVWTLGAHRLMCGDSSSRDDVERLVAGETMDLVNTDPPYNIGVKPRTGNAKQTGTNYTLDKAGGKSTPKMRARDRTVENDDLTTEQFAAMLLLWFGNMEHVLKPGGVFYIWGCEDNLTDYPPALKASGLRLGQTIVWVKGAPTFTRRDFMGNHELCFYGWRQGAGHKFYGPANISDVWEVRKVMGSGRVHLTEKPVELAKRSIEHSTLPGERVLDLFGGSGSTLIAAEMTGRRAYAMEIDPAYCDVIVQRWEKFTGLKAERFTGGFLVRPDLVVTTRKTKKPRAKSGQ